MEASTSAAPAPTPIATAPPLPRIVIREGDNVLIKLPSALIKPIKISSSGNINLGKYGSFKGKDLIGKPYGDTYEIKDGDLFVVQSTLTEIEETAANNENISSTGAQKLTFIEIESLKNSGKSGREIIQKQVEEHSAFELKTEYSKDKYLKRKEAKYLQMFTPLEPTVHTICEYNFEKQMSKIRDLRPDTLSQMMSIANVRPGSKLLIVEDLHGMVVGAAVDRMGGEGRILVINDFDSPPDLHLLDSFNFSPSDLSPITSIHWAATEESYTPPDLPLELTEVVEDVNGLEKAGKQRNNREMIKLKKRKLTYDKTKEAREEFFRGGFDGVIIACEYEPFSILQKLLPSIAGSAPIVIFSPYLQVLFSAHTLLKQSPSFLSPSITEPWLRKYQVLPGRTHPEMNGMNHGGFLLSVIRVFDDESAKSVVVSRGELRERKKRKLVEKAEGDEAKAEAEE